MTSLKKTDYNIKNTDIEGKMPGITGLATIVVLYAVKNKIPKVSDLVKKHIMMQKYQIWRLNIVLHLVITSLQVI